MGEAAEDLKYLEDLWLEYKITHRVNKCLPGCLYCEEDFEPVWSFQ